MSSKSKSSIPEPTPISKASSPATPRAGKLSKAGGVAKSDATASSPSPLSNRLSVDRSPKTVISKPVIDRRSPKLATPPKAAATPPPEKQPSRISKGSELQAQLSSAQEDLKKTKEKLVLVEQEKDRAIEELKEAHRLAEDANAKLREASVAQKRAEEDSEIEKFRAVEMEQAGIEAAQKKEDEWQRELDAMRNQHALDVAALLSTTQEMQRMKQELDMTCDAKNQALSHAEEATKIAEVHAEKVEILTAELVKLKALLDSKHGVEANEQSKLVHSLNAEMEVLKQELERVKIYEKELVEKESLIEQLNVEHARLVGELNVESEALEQERERFKVYEKESVKKDSSIEQLNVELEAAKLADSYARNVMEELKKKVEELEVQVDEANRLERSVSKSLESTVKQLEQSNNSFQDANLEVASLQEKVSLLETTVGGLRVDLEDSNHLHRKTVEKASELEKKVESLMSELQTVKEEKAQALNNEKLASASIKSLSEEKDKLVTQLEYTMEEELKSKKAMESLAAALHEVSSQTKEVKEQLLTCQAENEKYKGQMEDLKLALKSTGDKYEGMLDDAKHEIADLTNSVEQCKLENEKSKEQMEDLKLLLKETIDNYERMLSDAKNVMGDLTNSIEQSKLEYQGSKAEWEQKELHLTSCLKQFEDDTASMEKEITTLVGLLKQAEEKAYIAEEEGTQLRDTLKKSGSEVIYLKEVIGESKAETMRLREDLLDRENELQSALQENEDLRTRETATVKKIEELSKALEEAMTKKEAADENGVISDSEKDYDMLPKVVEFSEQNGGGREDTLKFERPVAQSEQLVKEPPAGENNLASGLSEMVKVEKSNENPKDSDSKGKEEEDVVEVDYKMWESCKIGESPERDTEQESFDEELDSKVESGESYEHTNGSLSAENVENGGTSPSKEQLQKKKKPLLKKFGSLLRKKGSINQK